MISLKNAELDNRRFEVIQWYDSGFVVGRWLMVFRRILFMGHAVQVDCLTPEEEGTTILPNMGHQPLTQQHSVTSQKTLILSQIFPRSSKGIMKS
jgi:hypothetical protein